MKIGSPRDAQGNTIGGSTALTGSTVFYVPDPTLWEDTGISGTGVDQAHVMRIGNKLYAFGGAPTYTASYVENPTFTSSGVSPNYGSPGGVRGAIIDNKIYCFGGWFSGVNIFTASLSDPLNWGDSGADIVQQRDNAPLVVANGRIMLMKGYNGGGYNTVITASVTNPLSWAVSVTCGNTAWQSCGFTSGGNIFCVGGFSDATAVAKSGTSLSSSLQFFRSVPYGLSIDTDPQACQNGTEVFVVGNNNADVYCTTTGMESMAWNVLPSALPASVSYRLGANWIGPDGRFYMVGGSPAHIWRSGRKPVYVLNSVSASAAGPYDPLPGTFADGTPAVVSRHVRMGMAPWQTNLTGSF